jgi:ABC-type glycerol-3-phosphate transport system substrate-binding protein
VRSVRSRKRIVAAALAVACAALAACSSSGSSGSSASSSSSASTSTTVAKSITVWTASNPLYAYQQSQLATFTKSTGIKVNFDQIPEASILTKLQAAQTAHDSSFDFYEVPESLTPQYVSLKGATPIKPFLDNTSLTPSTYDFAGLPSGSMTQCTVNGTLYCVPAFSTGPLLYYNKQMFAQAGISGPPQTMAALVTDAGKLTNSSHAGICLRGSNTAPNSFPGQMMLLYYLTYQANGQGIWLNSNYTPRLTEPAALQFANNYSTLMTKDAPKGVGAYGYPECLAAMTSGKVAMWLDDSAAASYVFNGQGSAVKNVGYASIPCPPTNPSYCQLSAPWGMFINPNVSAADQAAAYKLMTFLSGPAFEQGALTTGKIPALVTRPSVLTSASSVTGIPTDLLTSLAYIQTHIDPNAIPATPVFNQAQQPLNVALSDIISGQSNPDSAFKTAQTQITAILTQNGVIK